MKVRRIKILFLISCSILTVTACAKSKAESGASSPDQENSIEAEVTANHKQEELPLSQDMTSESSPTESAQVADENPSVNSSLFTPQKMSFEGNEFSNYLENTIQPENISCRIFGFHAPAEYTSDTSQDFLLSLEVLTMDGVMTFSICFGPFLAPTPISPSLWKTGNGYFKRESLGLMMIV